METIDAFIMPIFSKELSIDNSKLESFCLSQRKIDSGKSVSNVGGWQSNNFDLNNSPEPLTELCDQILKCAYTVSRKMQISNISDGDIWLNINEYSNFNWAHTHPGCSLSGVYYVKTPIQCGDIMFEHPSMREMGWIQIENFNKYNASSFSMASKEGMLYIFPSWMIHKVNPNSNKKNRISISFNLS